MSHPLRWAECRGEGWFGKGAGWLDRADPVAPIAVRLGVDLGHRDTDLGSLSRGMKEGIGAPLPSFSPEIKAGQREWAQSAVEDLLAEDSFAECLAVEQYPVAESEGHCPMQPLVGLFLAGILLVEINRALEREAPLVVLTVGWLEVRLEMGLETGWVKITAGALGGPPQQIGSDRWDDSSTFDSALEPAADEPVPVLANSRSTSHRRTGHWLHIPSAILMP